MKFGFVHPNWKLFKNVFLCILFFLLSFCTILPLSLSINKIEADNASQRQYLFCVATDGSFSKLTGLPQDEYDNVAGGTISISHLQGSLQNVNSKPYQKKLMCPDGVSVSISFSPNDGYSFAGVYYMQTEYQANEGDGALVHTDSAPFTFNSSPSKTGVYVIYFEKTVNLTRQFHNSFEIVNDDTIGYDYDVIQSELAETIYGYPENTTGSSFDIEVVVNQNIDFRVDLVRLTTTIETISSSDFVLSGGVFKKTFSNNLYYNNFSDKTKITYKLVVFPKTFSINIDWNGELYYNPTDTEIKSDSNTTFSGYYKTRTSEKFEKNRLNNSNALAGFNTQADGLGENYAFDDIGTLFLSNKNIFAIYDRSNLIDIKFVVVGDETREFVSHITKRIDETLTTADFPSSEKIYEGISNIAVESIGASVSYSYSYKGSTETELSLPFSLNLTTTKSSNVLTVYISIEKPMWKDSVELIPANSDQNIVTINNASELLWLANQVNNGNTFENKTIELGGDINLSSKYWTPIGSASFDGLLSDSFTAVKPQILFHLFPEIYQSSHYFSTLEAGQSSNITLKPFQGVFDGKNHTITNMIVSSSTLSTSSNDQNVLLQSGGLFGYCLGATIKNLNIESSSVNGYAIAGSVVGVANDCLIANVSANVKVDTTFIGENRLGYISIGGICGISYDCQFENIKSLSSLNLDRFHNKNLIYSAVGGIVGYSYSTIFSRSFFDGNMGLNVTNALIHKNNFFGGIAGQTLEGEISNCYNTGIIVLDGENQFGGISGDGGLVQNCFSMPELSTKTILDHYNAIDNNIIGFTQNSYSSTITKIVNSYYATSGALQSAELCYGKPKIESELSAQSTFEGWDFDNVWTMGATHPVLTSWTYTNGKTEMLSNWKETSTSILPNGEGSSDNPYKIENVENLIWIDERVNAGENFYGKYFEQTQNIDLGGKEWIPLCSELFSVQEKIDGVFVAIQKNQYGFAGIYDGGGHEVSNLTMTQLVNNLGGFFGKTCNASISNLIIRNADINSTSSRYSVNFDICAVPSFYVGGIVGYAESSDFSACQTFDSSISACGLAQMSFSFLLSTLAQQVGVRDFVQMTFAKYYKLNYSCVGGVVGYASDNSNLEVCYFTKSSSVNDCIVEGFSAGGVIGFCEGNVVVKSSGSSSAMLDGTAPKIVGSFSGGIAGVAINSDALLYLFLGNIDTSNFVFLETVFAKNVEFSYCDNASTVEGRFFAGGIVGLSDATINSSFNIGKIYGMLGMVGLDVNSTYIANVGVQIGGIAGWAKNIYDSYNVGDVYAIGEGRLVYEFSSAVAGGISGKAEKIYNSYNNGKISVKNGSILNYNSQVSLAIASGITGIATPKSEIINCLNLNDVTSELSLSASFIGRILTSDLLKNIKTNVNFNGITVISKSYYNSTKNSTSIGYVQNGLKTDTNLFAITDETRFYGDHDYLMSSYWDGRKSWDLVSIWTSVENGFPVLQQYKYAIYIETDFVHEDFSYSGQGFYTPGQVVTIKAELPIGYYAQWVLPNGEVYVGNQITKTLIYELSGTYRLNVLEKNAQSYITVRARYSSEVTDFVDFYADQYGIRPNLIIGYNAVEDKFEYVSETNILEVGYQRENYVLVEFRMQDGTLVNGKTNFVLLDNNSDSIVDIYAVWEPVELFISVSVNNGVATGGTTINKTYSTDVNLIVETQGNINCSFEGWYLKISNDNSIKLAKSGDGIPQEILDLYQLFATENINVSILQLYMIFSDLQDDALIESNSLSSVSLVANYVSSTVSLTIQSSNTTLGTVLVEDENAVDNGDGSYTIVVVYGSMYVLSAQVIGENSFLYWTNNQTTEKLYIREKASTFRLTQNTIFTANFAPKKAQIMFGATTGIRLVNGSYGTTAMEAGNNETVYSFEPLSGFYIHNVKIDGVSMGSITTYTFTNITEDHEIIVIAKKLATLVITVSAESSTIPVIVKIIIDENVYLFPLRNGQTIVFNKINQNMVIEYYLSVPTHFGYLATVNDSANYEGRFTTQQTQTLEISIYVLDNNYLSN